MFFDFLQIFSVEDVFLNVCFLYFNTLFLVKNKQIYNILTENIHII